MSPDSITNLKKGGLFAKKIFLKAPPTSMSLLNLNYKFKIIFINIKYHNNYNIKKMI